MLWVGVIAFEIVILFRSSRALERRMFSFLSRLLRPKVGLWTFSLIFFPGTYFHEISHLVVARLLGLEARLASLKPKKVENEIVMGSVSLVSTGSFRRFLTGVAPFVLGLFALSGLMYIFFLKPEILWWQWILWGYLVFQLGNTMFLSKEDMKGAWVYLVPIISVFCGLLFYFGLPYFVVVFLKQASFLLLLPIAINFIGIIFFNI